MGEVAGGKPNLTIDEVIAKKMTWIDCMIYYDPSVTEDQANNILWNQTCYPFCSEITLRQIKEYLTKETQAP